MKKINAINLESVLVTSALKTTMDGVKIIEVGKEYKVHNDENIGRFIIGEKGEHGLLTISSVEHFQKNPYGWVLEPSYSFSESLGY